MIRRRTRRPRNAGPGSGRRPPTSARRERALRSYPSGAAATNGLSGRHPPGALMRHGFSGRHGSHAGSRREESLRARSSFAVRRRAPTAVVGRSQDRRRVSGTVMRTVIRRSHSRWSMCRLPVTQCRPWTTEDLGASHALRPSRARGRGKTGGAIPRGEFLACDPCRPDNPRRISAPGMCRPRASRTRRGGRAQREYERRPFSGSRKGSSVGQGRHCVGSR